MCNNILQNAWLSMEMAGNVYVRNIHLFPNGDFEELVEILEFCMALPKQLAFITASRTNIIGRIIVLRLGLGRYRSVASKSC